MYGVGAVLAGSGTLWDDWGEVAASFALVDGGKTLLLKTGPEQATMRHRFELRNVPPAQGLTPCANTTELAAADAFYAGATLQLSVLATVHPGSGGGCLAVAFDQPLNSHAVRALLGMPYQQTRQRLHVIKQQFDDLTSTPSTSLMPLVAATNTATRISAKCQISNGGPSSAMDAWAAEMAQFPNAVDQALAALVAWARACPKSRFSVRTLEDCRRFSAQVTAWVCGTAALGRMELANCP